MLAVLIRHAVVPVQDRIGLRAELSLSEEGRRQARGLAERLKQVDLAAIFTSPLRRTEETAQAIAEGREVAVTGEPALVEVNPGEWDNRRFRDLAGDACWKFFNTFRGGTRIPGGEMMIEVQARAVTFLEKISHQFAARTVAVVSHADVIRAAICHYTGVPLDLSMRLEVSPASVSVLEIAEWGARLVRLNDTGELF